MPLTNAVIRKAKPACKPWKLSDSRGLYLLLNPNGSRWWRFKYRFEGKEKLLSLGTYPDTTLAEARDKRDAARQMLKRGINPSAERQQARRAHARTDTRAAETFEAIAHEWMSRQAVADITTRKSRWLFETYLFPRIGHLPLSALTPPLLLETLRHIEATGKLETAKRARIKMGQVFRHAMLEGKTQSDPTACLRGMLRSAKPRHHGAVTDPARIGLLLRAIDSYGGRVVTQAALKLAPLVFVRPGELRHAAWHEFDFEAELWRIPGERMKMKATHLVPLSAQAMALLRALHSHTGKGHYLFPHRQSERRPIGVNTLNTALRRLGLAHGEMTSHGFRSMAATRLNELGWNADAIERQLAHAESNKVREAYTHAAQYLDERRRMMQAWADYLDGLRAHEGAVRATATPGAVPSSPGGRKVKPEAAHTFSLPLPAFATTWPSYAAIRHTVAEDA